MYWAHGIDPMVNFCLSSEMCGTQRKGLSFIPTTGAEFEVALKARNAEADEVEVAPN